MGSVAAESWLPRLSVAGPNCGSGILWDARSPLPWGAELAWEGTFCKQCLGFWGPFLIEPLHPPPQRHPSEPQGCRKSWHSPQCWLLVLMTRASLSLLWALGSRGSGRSREIRSLGQALSCRREGYHDTSGGGSWWQWSAASALVSLQLAVCPPGTSHWLSLSFLVCEVEGLLPVSPY